MPTFTFDQDLQHMAITLMRKMNQLYVVLFPPLSFHNENVTVPYLFSSLALQRNLFPLLTTRENSGGFVSNLTYFQELSYYPAHVYHPKAIFPGFLQVAPPLESL